MTLPRRLVHTEYDLQDIAESRTGPCSSSSGISRW